MIKQAFEQFLRRTIDRAAALGVAVTLALSASVAWAVDSPVNEPGEHSDTWTMVLMAGFIAAAMILCIKKPKRRT